MPRKTYPGEKYKRIEQRAAEGDLSALVVPLDYFILDHLNDEGTMFAGLYPEAHTSAQLSEQRFEGKVDNHLIGTRFLVLRRMGFIVQVTVPGRGGGSSWQRTPAGKKALVAWQKSQQEVSDGQQ